MPSCDPADTLRVRVALIGGGAVSRIFYVPALADPRVARSLMLTQVVDLSAQTLDRLSGLPEGVEKVWASFENFLDQPHQLDAIIVALPHHLHEPCVTAALRRGLHVFCEKPLGLDEAESRRMLEVARQAGRVLAVCQPRRSYPAARAIRRLIELGWLGPIEHVTWEEGQPYAWPAESLALVQREHGGEELFDIGAHVFDLLGWWLGPLDVTQYWDDSRGGAGAEFQVGLVSRDLEARIDVRLSRLFRQANTAVIEGRHGRIRWDLKNPTGFDVQVPQAEPLSDPRVTFPGDDFDGPLYAFREQLKRFAEAVRRGPPPVATAEDAVRYAHVFTACRRAQQDVCHRSVVVRNAGLKVVTGASGFIGCRLVERLLEQGSPVRALVRHPQKCVRLARHPVDMITCDVLDQEAVRRGLQGADVVVHCAGSATSDPRTIVQGASNVLDAAEELRVRRVIVFSSMLAYGDPPTEGTFDEDLRWQGSQMPYARAKHEMEERCLAFAQNSCVEVVLLQPTCVFGAFGSDFAAAHLDAMVASTFVLIEDGKGVANLVHVDNVADAAILAAERPCASGSRYLVNEEEWRWTWADYFGSLSSSVLGIPLSAYPSLSMTQLEEAILTRRRAREFPAVLRRAIRAHADAGQWLANSWVFRLWSMGKRLGAFRRDSRSRTSNVPEGNAGIPSSPAPDVNLVAKMAAAEKTFLDVSMGRFFCSRAVFSSAKIRRELGWSPTLGRAAAMEATLAWAKLAYSH